MSRESLPTLLSLLETMQRFEADTLTDADRTLIKLVLRGITRDQDVRDYFWCSVTHRMPKHNPAAYCAALMYAVAEAQGQRLVNKRVQTQTGLTKDQVDKAREKYGPQCRAAVAQWGIEFSEQYLQLHLDDLRHK